MVDPQTGVKSMLSTSFQWQPVFLEKTTAFSFVKKEMALKLDFMGSVWQLPKNQ